MEQKKNKDSFDRFFKEHFSSACIFVERTAGDRGSVTDLAQEGFMKVYELWDTFESEENARAFLYISLRNLCFSQLRHRMAEKNYLSRLGEEAEDDRSAFLQEVMREETIRIIRTAVRNLPEQTRKVITLAMEGNSNKEVGEQLDISVNTVKSLKKAGYSVLRQVLSKEYAALLCALISLD